ncbi:MAG: lipoprotein insertase outer membrane protein LolB [Halioglobus sp.]
MSRPLTMRPQRTSPSTHATLWLLLTLLGGCAAVDQREPTTADWQAHSEQLSSLQQWTASGKLAVRTSDTSESASLIWQQDKQDTHLQLSGPLGMGATTIDSDGSQLHIRQGDTVTSMDISTPDAIELNTGWDLPLLALTHWLKGLPAPEPAIQRLQLDSQTQLLQTLQQDDWKVMYEQYGQFGGFILPVRLQIERGATRVKVVIAHWETSPG